MYPAMEKHMGKEGLELTEVDREQHQAVSVSPLFPSIPSPYLSPFSSPASLSPLALPASQALKTPTR